jgi:hypothetical protein
MVIKLSKKGSSINKEAYMFSKMRSFSGGGKPLVHIPKYFGDGYHQGASYIKIECIKYSVDEYLT